MSNRIKINPDDDELDTVWGAEAVGAVIGRSPGQVYYLLRTGALAGAARKIGFKTIIGSRRRLRELVLSEPKEKPE